MPQGPEEDHPRQVRNAGLSRACGPRASPPQGAALERRLGKDLDGFLHPQRRSHERRSRSDPGVSECSVESAEGDSPASEGISHSEKLLISIVLVSLGFTLSYYVGRRSLGPAWHSEARGPLPQQPASQAETKLGPWEARFSIPGSVQMPDSSPIIGFDIPKQSAEFEFFGYMNDTITNLTTSRYGIRYNIYGYEGPKG